MRSKAIEVLGKHLSDSDVRWKGCKDLVIDAMIYFAENNYKIDNLECKHSYKYITEFQKGSIYECVYCPKTIYIRS